ncbi:uncharacterized protein LOC111403585 [Olea europaea var. sylvestris]|uniref:uncharacterized protein LOC111403585 n=1 Tax=Olea europaea var. sylvestris TaxID=158386 RepID=UPI000C1D2062|nr:uncharacterized protein LOC111403585 [Olea europaea var. sylvestris]
MWSSERAIPRKTSGVYEVNTYSAISAKIDSLCLATRSFSKILYQTNKLEDHETVMLTEECSARIQKKFPPKLKYPKSFTVPCTIGDFYFDKPLCDLGASINLMPLSIFRKLGLGEPKTTTVTLQLADRSLTHP